MEGKCCIIKRKMNRYTGIWDSAAYALNFFFDGRLNKTKVEKSDVDFRAEREASDAEKRAVAKAEARSQAAAEAEEAKRRDEEKALRSYDSLFKPENMTTNCDSGNDSDDFM